MADVNEDLIRSIQLRALQASEDEIFSGIGQSLPENERMQVATAAALSVGDLLSIGKDFYRKTLRPEIETLICGKAKYCSHRQTCDTAVSITSLVAESVGEAVAQVHGIPKEAGGQARSRNLRRRSQGRAEFALSMPFGGVTCIYAISRTDCSFYSSCNFQSILSPAACLGLVAVLVRREISSAVSTGLAIVAENNGSPDLPDATV